MMRNTENRILFICCNKPEQSFSLDLSGQSLIMLEINDIFEMGCKEFNEKSKYFQIDRRNLYNQNHKNFQNKLDREYVNSEFEFKPVIRFFAVQKQINLIITDETKNNPIQFTLQISPINTNHELIDIIRKKTGVEASSFIQVKNETKKLFIYKNNNTLANSKISDNDRFVVFITDEEPKEDGRVGIPESFENAKEKPFVDLSNKDSIVKAAFSKTAPEYRIVDTGLNIEGICKNQNCKYQGKLQISPQGLGYTEIIGRLYNDIFCINKECNGQLEIETCGFYNCFFLWKGVKSVNGESVKVFETKYQNAETGVYTRINPKKSDGTSNKVFWINLYIETVSTQTICQICNDKLKSSDGVPFEKCDNQNVHLAHKSCADSFKSCTSTQESCFSCIR